MKIALYYPAWNAPWVSNVHDFDLVKLDKKYPGLNWINLAFAKPDMSYTKGQNSWGGTGLDFSMDFQIVKEAVALLRSRNICVMLSVGGGSYWSGDREFKTQAVADLVEDLGLNGVDIDYEVSGSGATLTAVIKQMRLVLPEKCYISMAAWSTGAFGNDGIYSGSAVDACKNAPVDVVNIMAYDAGDSYDAREAWKAYKKIFGGALLLGFEVGDQSWGGHLLSEEEVFRNATFVKENCTDQDGIFVWNEKSLGKPNPLDIITACTDVFAKPVILQPPPIVSASILCPVCHSKFVLQG
jgi:chitinase